MSNPRIELESIDDGQELLNLATGELFIALPQATVDYLRSRAIAADPCGLNGPASSPCVVVAAQCAAPLCILARAVLATFPRPMVQPQASLASSHAPGRVL